MYSDLKNITAKKKYIFVDCFDTLVFRVLSPNEVLKRWFLILSEHFNIHQKHIAEIWDICTHNKDNKREERTFYDVSCDLYNRLFYCRAFCNINKNEKDVYSYLLNSYSDVEKSVIYLNHELVDVLKREKKNGKKIYLVSDFYMPKEFFLNVFDHLEIVDLFDKIIVSSDIGLRKNSGNLYTWIINKFNLAADEIVMIGDNENSDCYQPRKIGIMSYKLDHVAIHDNKIRNHQLWKLFDDNYRHDPLANYSFSIYLFYEKLFQYVEKKI